MGDRGGATNKNDVNQIKFDQVNRGNAPGRGGATNSKGIGPIGSYSLDKGSTNSGNAKTNVGKPASS